MECLKTIWSLVGCKKTGLDYPEKWGLKKMSKTKHYSLV